MSIRQCRPPARLRNDNPALYSVSARNMSCAAVRHAMRIGKLIAHGFRTPGFFCHALHKYSASGVILGEIVRCVSGRRAFRFTWAT